MYDRSAVCGTSAALCVTHADKISDALDSDVGRRCRAHDRRIVRVMSLPYEYRRHAFTPDRLHGGKNPQLVVHHDVARGGILPLHLVEHLLFVDVDEDVAV